MQYFFANGNEQRGPYSLEEISAFGLRPDTLVWHEGMAQWQRADSLSELVASASVAPATPAVPSLPPVGQVAAQLNYLTPQSSPTDGMAIASMVLGIVSLVGLCFYGLGTLAGILAVIFGFVSRSRIKRSGAGGDGMARAGIIMGFISIGLVVLVVISIAVIAFLANT